MTTYLSADFVKRHIIELIPGAIPDFWDVDRAGRFYQLDLKMCQISALHFDFQWGRERSASPRDVSHSVLDTPSQIVLIHVSLNDLTFLHRDWLAPFSNLRALDASLNQLKHVEGIEALPRLRSLNLSHNSLRSVDGLSQCITLVELRLAVNELLDISAMPPLTNLRILDVSNNKLRSLNGLSSLPKLEELYVQRNELTDLLPVMSCGNLRILNAANNQIFSLDTTLKVLGDLRFLQSLSLYGNPVEREPHYQADILVNTTSIVTLDNVMVKPMARRQGDHQKHADNLFSLKDAAQLAFQDRRRVAKERLDDNVAFLQKRIVALQQEYADFETKLNADLESCLRYLDSLSEAELSTDRSAIGAVWGHGDYPHPWGRGRQDAREQQQRTDYSQIKTTDEVLRCAYNELVQQYHGTGQEF